MDTMTTSNESDLRVGLIPIEAWQTAVDAYRDGTLLTTTDEDDLVAWRSSGLLGGGELAGDWRRALDLAANSTVGMTLVARRGNMAFLTHLFAGAAEIATVTQRVRAAADSNEVVATDPTAEVALTASPWGALRRVLPPNRELRAAPTDAPAERIQVPATSLPGYALASPEAFTEAIRDLPSLPEGLQAADDADIQVFAFTANTDGGSDELVWYLSSGQLYRYEPRLGALWKVAAGDVAKGLTGTVASLRT